MTINGGEGSALLFVYGLFPVISKAYPDLDRQGRALAGFSRPEEGKYSRDSGLLLFRRTTYNLSLLLVMI